ncbi:MAG: alanine racemase [Halobacteriales archaeon]
MSVPTFSATRPTLGTAKERLETPAVIVDLDTMERNLDRLGTLADTAGVTVRPHVKAHKIPTIARQQESRYGPGVLAQKLSEAEVMVRGGVRDVVLVCPVVTDPKLDHIRWLAEHTDRFAMVVDCPGNVEPVAELAASHDTTIELIVEIDVGIERMGVEPGEDVRELVELIADADGVSLRGILGHDNHIPGAAMTTDDYEARCGAVADELERTVGIIEDTGTAVETVITGASATARYMADQPVVTELDPGRYLFNDASLLAARPEVSRADCALTVVTTVISRPAPDRAIVDAGSKTLSYVGEPTAVPKHRDDIAFYNRSSEHGWIDVSEAPEIAVGDRLEFIVPNAYGPINIHETLPGIRDGRVAELWSISARGKDK